MSQGTEMAARRVGGPDTRTVELVQSSWAKVAPVADATATLFYGRLFELEPSLRPLFRGDLAEQRKKLMSMLAIVVDGLGNVARLQPALRALGARHVGYRVADRHYEVVGEALLWMLRQGLGEAFTPEVEAAWAEVYGLVASVMKQGAAEQRAASASAAAVAET